MDEALATLADMGVTLKCGSIKYCADGTVATITVDATTGQARGKDQYQLAFERLHACYGFTREMLGNRFTHKGVSYELHGLAPNRSKFPIVGKGPDGKILLFTKSVVPQIQSGEKPLFPNG